MRVEVAHMNFYMRKAETRMQTVHTHTKVAKFRKIPKGWGVFLVEKGNPTPTLFIS